MASCAGTTLTSPMAFSRASTASSRPPRPRLEATDRPATSRRSSTSSPASSNSAYPPETARSQPEVIQYAEEVDGELAQLRVAVWDLIDDLDATGGFVELEAGRGSEGPVVRLCRMT